MILEKGYLLNNRYRIVEILGQGGMGSVYRAVDENLGIEVAVKDNLFTTEEYARQFRREAIILANLRHPNLTRVTDHFVIDGQGQYLVMDYIEGEDLRQRMERVGVLPEEEVIVIGAAVCDALSYLSSRKPPVIHRDIKPGNVKITPQGYIYLVDFGLAKTLQGSQATTTGARAMTPGFSPPEQYGTARTDQRSDIFSLGATLYAALTGVTPEDSLARAMDQAELSPIRKHNPHISRRLAGAVERSLEVHPEDRFQTAEEFKQALLSASSIQKRKEGDYYVTPPPEGEEQAHPSEDLALPVGAEGKLSLSEEKSPQPLPGNAVSEEQRLRRTPSRPRRRRKGSRARVFLLFFLVILVVVVAVVYRVDPGLPSRAYALYWPTVASYLPINTPTSFVIKEDTPTLIPSLPIVSVTEVLATFTSTPTSVAESTSTATPTDTPLPIPTPLGGGGGQIAYASNSTGDSQIYIINVDGTGRRQVTDIPEGACQPDWSPDGTRLVFISPCDSNREYYQGSAMYTINVDGTGMRPLPTLVGGDFDPKWSPDGIRIAFTSLRNSYRPQLYILNLEDNSVISLSEKYVFDFQPSWSPDGKQLIFISTRWAGQQIWVMDVDGQNPKLFSYSQGVLNSHPSWSPDMQMVLFTQSKEGGVPRVSLSPYKFVETSSDYVEYRVGQAIIPMKEGVYSPDGLWIAFEGWEAGGTHNIFIIAATGAGRFQLTTDPRIDFDPAWKLVP